VFRGVPVRTLLSIYKYSALAKFRIKKRAIPLRVFIYYCSVAVSMIWVPRERRAEDLVVLGEKYFCVVEDGERGFRDRQGIVKKVGVPLAWG
jgi:hypothetical protein